MAARSVHRALTRSLRAQPLLPADEAVTALALAYSTAIDEDRAELWHLGPRLLDALMELGMTPKVRAAILKGESGGNGNSRSPADELRARRERRAAAMDASAASADS